MTPFALQTSDTTTSVDTIKHSDHPCCGMNSRLGHALQSGTRVPITPLYAPLARRYQRNQHTETHNSEAAAY